MTGEPAVRMNAALKSLLLPFLLYAALVSGQNPVQPVGNISVKEIVARLTENNRKRSQMLQSFTGRREYHLLYTGFPGRREADMVVDVTYQAPASKDFKVVSETGSHLIINRVFRRLLESEKEASDEKNQARTALTEANYTFAFVGQEPVDSRAAYILQVEPRIDNKYLYRGRIWVDAADYAVAKIEAEPAKRPSFWISRTEIHHAYKKIGDFWLPVENQSATDVRLGGHAILSIHYRDYKLSSASGQVTIYSPPAPALWDFAASLSTLSKWDLSSSTSSGSILSKQIPFPVAHSAS